jgi:PilZ domain
MMATTVPSPEDSAHADRRAYPRVPLALPAFLQANASRHSVKIVDLSAGGAKLTCPVSLSAGTAVMLDCGTFRCEALVRWQTGGYLGLCFESELDVREVSALAERSKALAALMKTRE